MAEKAKKSNKNLIIGICVTALIVVVVAVAIFFATRGSSTISDSYFVSDGTKYVLTVNGDMLGTGEETEYTPVKTHVVYTYSDDTITGMTTYMEYADDATAKAALDFYSKADQTGIQGISQNGNYVVVEMSADQYSDMTASEVKEYLDFVESLKNVNLTDGSSEEVEEVEEVEEK